MSKQKEDWLRFQFKSGALIGATWLRNQGKMSQEEIDVLVSEGVLTKINKDPTNKISDDKYRLN